MLKPQEALRDVRTDSRDGKESCSTFPSSSPNICSKRYWIDRNSLSKRYKSCWLLTLTPATFSEGWWLLRPWSSARLRSLKNDIFYSKLVNYVPWLGRQPLHHDPAWPWWGHRDETRGRHRAVDLGTAATFIIRNNILVQTWELPKITCTSNSTMSAPWSMAYCMLANVFSLIWEQCCP